MGKWAAARKKEVIGKVTYVRLDYLTIGCPRHDVTTVCGGVVSTEFCPGTDACRADRDLEPFA